MKKFPFVAAFAFALVASVQTAKAQVANCWYNGYKATLVIPPLTANRATEYPTFQYQNPAFAPVTTVNVNEFYTYVKMDTIVGGGTVSLSIGNQVTAGAQLYLQSGGASDSARTVYLKQGSTPIDTITVTNHKIKRWYVFDGTLFQAFPK